MSRSWDSDFPLPLPDATESVYPWLPENPALSAEAVASGVLLEFAFERDITLPRDWGLRLVARAKLHAANNPHFRGLLCRPEDESRDWLWAFMKHWLGAAWQGYPRPPEVEDSFSFAAAAHFHLD